MNNDFRTILKKNKSSILTAVFFALSLIILALSFLIDKKLHDFFINNQNAIVHMLSLFSVYSYILVFLGGAFFLVFTIYTRKREQIPATILSIILTITTIGVLKVLFARERPEMFIPMAFNVLNYSFPAIIPGIFASIIPIIIQNKKIHYFTAFWIVAGVIISFLNLYVGIYYLSDIICGIIIGYSLGIVISIIFNKKNWL